MTLGLLWRFTYLAVWPWSSPLTSDFSSGKWAPWYFNFLDCICAYKEQVALRGLSGLLSLEQIWIILPPGEKEIFCFECMGAIPKAKYWFMPNDIYLWTLIQNPDWVDTSVFWVPTRTNDYWLRLLHSQPFQSAFPCQLHPAWNHTARRVVRLLVSFSFPTSPV